MPLIEKGLERVFRTFRPFAMAAALIFPIALVPPAAAELVVSQLIVEFKPGSTKSSDIEVANNSSELSYVLVEAREIVSSGLPSEKAIKNPDPAKLGLLVSPLRFVLEGQQRRILRIAAIGTSEDRERVYRVTVKPVTGKLTGSDSGLKLLVGYDLLVLVRPKVIRNDVQIERSGANLTIMNRGNASVEIAEGQQCDAKGNNCQLLPAKRLYAGASWIQLLPQATGGQYRVRSAEGWSTVKF